MNKKQLFKNVGIESVMKMSDNIQHPFSRKHMQEVSNMINERCLKCAWCSGEKIEYTQVSPDIGTLYFCSRSHYTKFSDSHKYRACHIKIYEKES